jgi:hypothetical protein
MSEANEFSLDKLLDPSGPACLIVTAKLAPVGEADRFQPAGFPEVGHVIYKAPRKEGRTEDVCIVDSPASMANHLETVCCQSATDPALHPDLEGLPYMTCVTDGSDGKRSRVVCTTLTEGHRIASDYFLDGLLDEVWKEGAAEGKAKKKLRRIGREKRFGSDCEKSSASRKWKKTSATFCTQTTGGRSITQSFATIRIPCFTAFCSPKNKSRSAEF